MQMMYAQHQQQQHQQQQPYAHPPGAAAGNQHLIATHMAAMGAPVQQLQQFNQAQQQQFQLMQQQHQQQQQAFASSSADTSAEAANYWGRRYPGVTYTNGKDVSTLCYMMHYLSQYYYYIYMTYQYLQYYTCNRLTTALFLGTVARILQYLLF
jgi:hypothetical protein